MPVGEVTLKTVQTVLYGNPPLHWAEEQGVQNQMYNGPAQFCLKWHNNIQAKSKAWLISLSKFLFFWPQRPSSLWDALSFLPQTLWPNVTFPFKTEVDILLKLNIKFYLSSGRDALNTNCLFFFLIPLLFVLHVWLFNVCPCTFILLKKSCHCLSFKDIQVITISPLMIPLLTCTITHTIQCPMKELIL